MIRVAEDDSFVLCEEKLLVEPNISHTTKMDARGTQIESRDSRIDCFPENKSVSEPTGDRRSSLPDDIVTMKDVSRPTIVSNVSLKKKIKVDFFCKESEETEKTSPGRKRIKRAPDSNNCLGFEKSEQLSQFDRPFNESEVKYVEG